MYTKLTILYTYTLTDSFKVTETHSQPHTRPHSGRNLTPSIFQLSNKNIHFSWLRLKRKKPRRAASQPIRISGDFDFSPPPPRLARAAPRGRRPRQAIGRFSRLHESHLNTPRSEAHYGAAGSNWLSQQEQGHNGGEITVRTHCWQTCVSVSPCGCNRNGDYKEFGIVSFVCPLFVPVKETAFGQLSCITQEVSWGCGWWGVFIGTLFLFEWASCPQKTITTVLKPDVYLLERFNKMIIRHFTAQN